MADRVPGRHLARNTDVTVEGVRQVLRALEDFEEADVVVAHPDDEILLYGAVLLAGRASRSRSVRVICVTDGRQGCRPTFRLPSLWARRRAAEFSASCADLGLDGIQLGVRDRGVRSRVPTDSLASTLDGLLRPTAAVFTHSVMGEYGHPHHLDVVSAVSRVRPDAWYRTYLVPGDQAIDAARPEWPDSDVLRDHFRRFYPSQTHGDILRELVGARVFAEQVDPKIADQVGRGIRGDEQTSFSSAAEDYLTRCLEARTVEPWGARHIEFARQLLDRGARIIPS